MSEDLEGEPIHCHECATFTEIESGECSNCGASQTGYSTPAESAAGFRDIVELTGPDSEGGREAETAMDGDPLVFDREIHIYALSLVHILVGCALILHSVPGLLAGGTGLGILLLALGGLSYYANAKEGFYE